jgi:Domain of unknown function (DUF1905)
VDLEFSGEIWFWRGPSPFHFVSVPAEESADIGAVAAAVTYGWGVIPVTARIGRTGWTTSLFPKDGQYLVPVKAAVRKAEGLELGDTVVVQLSIDMS